VNYKGRARSCNCLLKVDSTCLSFLEQYVDGTWKHLSEGGKCSVAANTVAVEGFGTKGKFLLPFANGAFFHPVCAHTWARLLGCTVKENREIVRTLERLSTKISAISKSMPVGSSIILDGGGCVMYFQQPVEGVDHDLKRLKRKTVKRIAGEHLHPPDMPKIAKEMLVEPAKMLLYLIMNLKYTPHGSELRKRLPDVRRHHEQMGIPLIEVTQSQAVHGEVGIDEMRFNIAYPGSRFVNAIENAVPDLPKRLVEYMINAPKKFITVDETRMDHAHFVSVEEGVERMQRRIQFGFTQIQRTKNVNSLRYAGEKMPSCSYKQFTAMPEDLREMIFKVLSIADEYVLSKHEDAFPDGLRYNLFGNWLRGFLECKPTDPMFRWEYIDILITANSKLCRHMDHVDDDTDGYDYNCVHSFNYSLDGVDYKVSIIMTTRDRLARAMDKIRPKLEKEGAAKYKLLGGPGHRPVKFKYATECNAPRPTT